MRCAGVVLDFAAPLAQEVVDGHLALDAAYKKACEARDAERRRLEDQERIAAEEADAKAFVESNAPDLAAQVGGAFESYAEAQAVWEKRNREEAARIAAEKRQQAEREKALRENAEQNVQSAARALTTLHGMSSPEWRSRLRQDVIAHPKAASPVQREPLIQPGTLREIAAGLNDYADELEHS